MFEYKVAIIMGSPNDRPKMEPAAETLAGFGIEADVRVMSAHRTPHKVSEFVGGAREAGYAAVMPSFEGKISEDDLVAIVAYIKSLGDQARPTR